MSLHAAAQHLSSQGRGPDTTLVHMSRDEVKSLNDLAMAHGGHLTVNPQTGLPEAGFLNKLLPTIIGAGLTVATGGAAAPWMIGLGVGGLEAARTGDLKKGIMAGLGAYGGAGIGSALAQSGVQAAAPDALANSQQVQNIARPEQFYEAGTTNLTPAGQQYVNQVQSTINPTLAQQDIAQRAFESGTMTDKFGTAAEGVKSLGSKDGLSNFYSNLGNVAGTYGPMTTLGAAALPAMQPDKAPAGDTGIDSTPASPLEYQYGAVNPTPAPDVPAYGNLGRDFGRQQNYFPNQGYVASTKEKRGFAGGGPIEAMSDANAVGANTGYPMADISKGAYATPYQTPISRNVIGGTSDTGVNPMTGEMQFARGGLSDLGDYSDGGRLLRGPGDGVSDSIPAQIGKKQPARLADGEFVVPARIVSELGNGSTEAGARKLYAMMDRVQKARGKTVGKGKVAKNSRADRHLPA